MNYHLPSRDECQKLAQESEVFYCQNFEIDGYLVEIYNYRLANYSDFKDNNAWELRGLTFVQDKNGEWHRHILMNKFFNLNQNTGWMYDDVKDKKVIRVQDKLDGSIISFIKLPNSKIVAKSKMSFDSDQAKMAQEIFDNSWELSGMIETILDDGKMPIFELISPHNQIVLSYPNTELRLLQIRDNETGEYASDSLMWSYLRLYDLQKMCAQDYSIEQLNNIAGKYTEKQLHDKIRDMRFDTFHNFLEFIRS